MQRNLAIRTVFLLIRERVEHDLCAQMVVLALASGVGAHPACARRTSFDSIHPHANLASRTSYRVAPLDCIGRISVAAEVAPHARHMIEGLVEVVLVVGALG